MSFRHCLSFFPEHLRYVSPFLLFLHAFFFLLAVNIADVLGLQSSVLADEFIDDAFVIGVIISIFFAAGFSLHLALDLPFLFAFDAACANGVFEFTIFCGSIVLIPIFAIAGLSSNINHIDLQMFDLRQTFSLFMRGIGNFFLLDFLD